MAVQLTPSKYRLAVFKGGSMPFALVNLWDKEGDLVCSKKGILNPPLPWEHSDSRYNIATGKVCDDDWSGDRPAEVLVEAVTGRAREVMVIDPDGLMEQRLVIMVEQLQAVEP